MLPKFKIAVILLAGLATTSFAAMQLTMTANGWTRSWGGVVQGSEYPYILIGNEDISGTGYENQGILKFSLSALTANVTSASLYVYVEGVQFSPDAVAITSIDAGTGTAVTFADSYATALSTATTAFTSSSSGWVAIDVATLVNAAKTAGAGYVAFRLEESPYVQDNSHNDLYLVGSGSSANQPYLTYTIPEPATLGLLALGVLPLLRRRR